jgi:hypothetical protein
MTFVMPEQVQFKRWMFFGQSRRGKVAQEEARKLGGA